MFNWLSRLLHWRKSTNLISKGTMTQFIPVNGIYVIARRLGNQTSLTILNGTKKPATLDPKRYEEVIKGTARWKDVPTGRYFDLSKPLELKPRQTLVLTN